jgi:hypothetical protein
VLHSCVLAASVCPFAPLRPSPAGIFRPSVTSRHHNQSGRSWLQHKGRGRPLRRFYRARGFRH